MQSPMANVRKDAAETISAQFADSALDAKSRNKDSGRKMMRLTKKELWLINDMCAIASAAVWGEGDYQSWNDNCEKTFESLRDKIFDELYRKAKQGAKVARAGK